MHQGFGNQGFQPKFNPYVEYVIRSALDNEMVLSIGSGSGDDEVMIMPDKQYNYQKFHIYENNNKFIFQNANGKVLEIPGGSSNQGVGARGGNRTENMNQIWELQPSKHDSYSIKSFCGLVLDVC